MATHHWQGQDLTFEMKLVAIKASIRTDNQPSLEFWAGLSNGKPTLAEFGRGTCIPCKQMKPILENLAVEYQDRLNVPL